LPIAKAIQNFRGLAKIGLAQESENDLWQLIAAELNVKD
jgi:hypothetical protein